jgi:hypothetical protein
VNIEFLKPLVADVLRSKVGWTVQGFGFLRTYFGPPSNPKEFRLNVWDSSLTVPGVSTIHDHPWHFVSFVVAGCFQNQRYTVIEEDDGSRMIDGPDVFDYTTIKTGEGGGMTKSPIRYARLRPGVIESFSPGQTYSQGNTEIHETIFSDGCVTLNKRKRVGDGEHARVFWPHGTQWVDAEPRPANWSEVALVTGRALENFPK